MVGLGDVSGVSGKLNTFMLSPSPGKYKSKHPVQELCIALPCRNGIIKNIMLYENYVVHFVCISSPSDYPR